MREALVDTDERSPVVAIKQKELELAAELAAAREVTKRTVAEARQWALAYLRQVEPDARAFAATDYRMALETIDAEAAEIRATGERAALTIAERGAVQMDIAVGRILRIVVPRVAERGALVAPTTSVGQEAQVRHA